MVVDVGVDDTQLTGVYHHDTLMDACRVGDIETVKRVINEGVIVNIHGTLSGRTPLHWATMYKHTSIVKLLLDAGANPNIVNFCCNTPLHLASMGGKTSIVKLLLEAGTNVNKVGYNGETSLYLASSSGHIEVTKLLLNAMMYS